MDGTLVRDYSPSGSFEYGPYGSIVVVARTSEGIPTTTSNSGTKVLQENTRKSPAIHSSQRRETRSCEIFNSSPLTRTLQTVVFYTVLPFCFHHGCIRLYPLHSNARLDPYIPKSAGRPHSLCKDKLTIIQRTRGSHKHPKVAVNCTKSLLLAQPLRWLDKLVVGAQVRRSNSALNKCTLFHSMDMMRQADLLSAQ